jgi:hypothetical protein
MSSILKALRKIEAEKQVNKSAAPDLMSDQGFVPLKAKPFVPVLSGVAIGAVLVGLLFLWVLKEPATVVTTQPEPKPEHAELVAAADQPQVISSSEQEEKIPDSPASLNTLQISTYTGQNLDRLTESAKVSVVTLSPDPAALAEKHSAQTSSAIVKNPVKPIAIKTKAPEIKAIAGNPARVKQEPRENVVDNTTPNSSSGLPLGISLLVSEIFYQEDSANSMAVVNDLPVMVGSYVDSAVVNEIRPDSVVFEIGSIIYNVNRSRP